MKHFYVFIVILMGIGFMASIVGCNNNPKKEKLEFYYYPDKNVYYDVANETFIYSVDGAKTWSAMDGDIKKDQATLGKKEIIYSDTDSIWKNNEIHRSKYQGALYSIVSGDTAEVVTGGVSERKVAKKSKASSGKRVEEKQKKQPIKNFFKKIFGKKKKD